MIDAGEDEVSRGIGRGRIVIYRFKTIFAHKNRATSEVKLKCLAKRVLNAALSKRVLNTVLRISVGRGKVLNALERVARDRAKSQQPVLSNRKKIHRIEKRRPHALRADSGWEIQCLLHTAVIAGVE